MPPASTPPKPATSRYAIASWGAVVGGLGLTFVGYQAAVATRRPGDWFPGFGEAIIGIALTAVASVICGLTAFLRREPRRWLALPPLAGGLGVILWFGWRLSTRWG